MYHVARIPPRILSRRVLTAAVAIAALIVTAVAASPQAAQAVTPVYSISGQVSLGSTGTPAAAGEITIGVWPASSPLSIYPMASATTNSTGAYTVSGLTAGTYDVRFDDSTAHTYPSAWWTPFQDATHQYADLPSEATTVVVASAVTGTDITLPQAASVSGRVTRSNGLANSNSNDQILVTRLPASGSNYYSTLTETNYDGTYTLGGLLPGQYNLTFRSLGFPPDGNTSNAHAGASVLEPARNDTLTVTAGQTLTNVNATQFTDSSVTLNATCVSCVGRVSDTYHAALQYLDPVSQAWSDLPSNITYLPFYWPMLYPGTYRAEILSNTDNSVVARGSNFQLAEGQTTTQALTIATPTWLISPVRSHDFMGDGTPQVVARDSGVLYLYRTDGAGGWSTSGREVGPGAPSMFATLYSVGDFDHNGVPDLVARDSVGYLTLYDGDRSGGWGPGRVIGAGWNIFTAIAAVGDFDGDGYQDLVARDASGYLWLYPGNGSGGFKPRSKIGSGWNIFTSIVGAGDFNGDGYPDILARTSDGSLMLYPHKPSGWGTVTRVGGGWNMFNAISSVGDFDGDHITDILARTPAGALYLYPGNGASGWKPSKIIATGWNVMSSIG